PFVLLSDVDRKVLNRYGVYGEKTTYGVKSIGVIRSHFVIDETGHIVDAQVKVRAVDSAPKALASLQYHAGAAGLIPWTLLAPSTSGVICRARFSQSKNRPSSSKLRNAAARTRRPAGAASAARLRHWRPRWRA